MPICHFKILVNQSFRTYGLFSVACVNVFLRLGGRVVKALDCKFKTVSVVGFEVHLHLIVFQWIHVSFRYIRPFHKSAIQIDSCCYKLFSPQKKVLLRQSGPFKKTRFFENRKFGALKLFKS